MTADFAGARARLARGARPRLQRHQLLEAGRVGDARPGGRRGPRRRAARRHLDRGEERAHHRRPHPPRRRGRRPRGDRLAAALRHGESEVLPAALRAPSRAKRPSASASFRSRSTRPTWCRRRSRSRASSRWARRSAIRWTKYSLNNWLRMAGPSFDASLALEFMGFTGPEVREGMASLKERRAPKFDPDCPF